MLLRRHRFEKADAVKLAGIEFSSRSMKRFFLTTCAWGLLAFPAMAADMGPFYRAPLPVAVVSWTGPYVGATLGGGWADSNVTESVGATFCNPAVGGCTAGPAASAALAAAVPGTFSAGHSGAVGGGEFGYNWQTGLFVLGFEADISGSTISGGTLVSGASAIAGFPANTVAVSGSANAKVDYLGTVRGRAGFLLMPPLLTYLTAGLAYGGASSNTTLSESVDGPCSCGDFPAVHGSSSTPRLGWTFGGGMEYMFAPHWTVKAEYLYYDLGSVTYALPPIVQTTATGVPFFGATTASHIAFTGNIARAGVNFGF
jgi:outer membrane immunogenic protein